MRVEIDIAEATGTALHRGRAPAVAVPRRRRVDWFEVAVLAVFAAMSVWVLALDLWQVVAHGRVWTGTDGVYLVDQMQYLAWIRDASHGVLASNLFVLRSTPADYFQPAVAISAGLSALGVAPWLSLLLWKPVAVLCAFLAVRRYVGHSLTGLWSRRVALVLGLFFGSFSVVYGSFGVVGDLMPGFLSWGYTFGLLAVALLLLALLAYDRVRDGSRRLWVPGLLGALAALLHPWQGELLIVIVLGTELVLWPRSGWRPRRLALPAITVITTSIPLAYYAILGRADLSWDLARDSSKHAFSIWTIMLAVAPLAVPAALAYRRRRGSFLAVATRTWPFAALAVWVLSATELSATPLHAFEGITVPLAILAVQGAQRLGWNRLPRRRLLGALAVALATVPATVYLLSDAATLVAPSAGNASFIASDEHRALEYLAHDPQAGGVLTRFYLGTVVPAQTGRKTFVGDCLWSAPGCSLRAQAAQGLLDGTLPADIARTLVRSSGARFVLADCQAAGALTSTLAPITVSVHRFGCASVYEIDAPGRPIGPLAQSGGDAAVRAPRRQ
jgi:hypothetical protein